MSKYFCPTCLNVFKNNVICGKCGSKRLAVNNQARAPRSTAKFKEWKTFADMFLYNQDTYDATMVTLGKKKVKEEAATKPKSPALKHELKFELVEFLVDTHRYVHILDPDELLRNGRGYNKWAQRELIKEFEKRLKSNGYEQLHSDSVATRAELISSLIFEKEFGL
ncbi:hypothetical protein KAR91_22495 [Candidatus Pacearchaeota archaeon]|nr:hypothetical protein [Candidatus Pacearchaeota archaeon]